MYGMSHDKKSGELIFEEIRRRAQRHAACHPQNRPILAFLECEVVIRHGEGLRAGNELAQVVGELPILLGGAASLIDFANAVGRLTLSGSLACQTIDKSSNP